jgi:hypothetical protein
LIAACVNSARAIKSPSVFILQTATRLPAGIAHCTGFIATLFRASFFKRLQSGGFQVFPFDGTHPASLLVSTI